MLLNGVPGGLVNPNTSVARSAPSFVPVAAIEMVVDIAMTKDEQAMFDKSVDAVKGLVTACKAIDETLA